MQQTLTHGTVIKSRGGRPVRGWDRRETPVFEAEWDEDRLVTARLRLPDGRWAVVKTKAETHPIFGLCDAVGLAGGPILARFQAVDWSRPARIPPLDRPGALPSGAGTAILNLLARQALQSGQERLRYRGPYPTGALFDALTGCFRLPEGASAAFSRFTARVEETAATAEMYEPPVDFVPAPFERVWFEAGVCVQLRAGVEKIYVDGRAYARDAAGARRVRPTDEGYVAVVEIGGTVWAEVVRLDGTGNPLEQPRPLPEVASPYLDRPLPDSVRAALVEALPPRAPALMQATVRHVLAETPIIWGDPGDDVAAIREGTIVLHAVLLERLEGQAPNDVLTAIALAVEPAAQRLAQAKLARAVGESK